MWLCLLPFLVQMVPESGLVCFWSDRKLEDKCRFGRSARHAVAETWLCFISNWCLIMLVRLLLQSLPLCPECVILHNKFPSYKLLWDSMFSMLIFKLNFCIFSEGVSCSHYCYQYYNYYWPWSTIYTHTQFICVRQNEKDKSVSIKKDSTQ